MRGQRLVRAPSIVITRRPIREETRGVPTFCLMRLTISNAEEGETALYLKVVLISLSSIAWSRMEIGPTTP